MGKTYNVAAFVAAISFVGVLHAFNPPKCRTFPTQLNAVDPIVDAYRRTPKPSVEADPRPAVTKTPDVQDLAEKLQNSLLTEGSRPENVPPPPDVSVEQIAQAAPTLRETAVTSEFEKAPPLWEMTKNFVTDLPTRPINSYFAKQVSVPKEVPHRETPILVDYLRDIFKEESGKSISQQVAEFKTATTDFKSSLSEQLAGARTLALTSKDSLSTQLADKKGVAVGAGETFWDALNAMKSTGSAENTAVVQGMSSTVTDGTVVAHDFYAKLMEVKEQLVDQDWAGLSKEFPLNEVAPWVVAGFAIVWGIGERENGREEIRFEFEQKLNAVEGKAVIAAQSATLAAEGAKAAREMMSVASQSPASQSTKETQGTKSADLMLETSKTSALRAELMLVQEKMNKMRDQESRLLEKVSQAEKVAAEAKQQALDAEMSRINTTNLVETLTMELSAMKAKLDALEAKTVPETAVTGLETKTVAAMEAGTPTQTIEVEGLDKSEVSVLPDRLNSVAVVDTNLKKARGDSSGSRKAKATSQRGSAKTKRKAPKAKKKAKVTLEASDDPNPWASLSAASLKRKTVKDLTGYLSERGVETSGENGKVLKKDVLVALVQDL